VQAENGDDVIDMEKVTKCDVCKKRRKLYFFKNTVDSGFTAYCKEDAIKMGLMSADGCGSVEAV